MPSDAPLDWKTAVAQLDGRDDLLRQVAQTFDQESAKLLADIRDSIAQNDVKRLRRAAHSLKGAAGIFLAGPATAAARDLEFLARDGNLQNAPNALAVLETELQRLLSALHRLLQ